MVPLLSCGGMASKSSGMPERFRPLLADPRGDFMEATIVASDDDDHAVECAWTVIDGIVEEYGGRCNECGPIEPEHIPFSEIFGAMANAESGDRNITTTER